LYSHLYLKIVRLLQNSAFCNNGTNLNILDLF
jgi:hypothetical protein